jgi:glycosyltransferase involved in cell wall biosynthesis
VIVSDGSTDETDSIVTAYTKQFPWIELLRMPERVERDFAGKVHAFNRGLAKVEELDFEIIGSLDADISFDNDYFQFLIGKFMENPKLGLAGTPFREGTESYDYRYVSLDHVSGACQVFRRTCFDDIGGYVPVKGGGVDLIAVLKARMKGWQTRTFLEKASNHARRQGSARHGKIATCFNVGMKDYVLGGSPLWEVFRCLYQIRKSPMVVGGCTLLAGFLWAMMCRRKKVISSDLIAFRRGEQMTRLRTYLASRMQFAGCRPFKNCRNPGNKREASADPAVASRPVSRTE